jgi:hypothetical protein
MTDAMRTFRRFLTTTDQLRNEIRPLPTLDPGTDRADDTDVWMHVAGFQSEALNILALSDCEITPHLEDLRRLIEAIDRRISPLGG